MIDRWLVNPINLILNTPQKWFNKASTHIWDHLGCVYRKMFRLNQYETILMIISVYIIFNTWDAHHAKEIYGVRIVYNSIHMFTHIQPTKSVGK